MPRVKDGDLSGNTEDQKGVYQNFTDRTGAKITMPSLSFDAYLKSMDKNVFDIQQGVAVAIMVKYPKEAAV